MGSHLPDESDAPAVDAAAGVEATEPTAGEPNAGGRAPDGDPRRCTAHNRRGERCGRWASPGKSVCQNHGARSTGPRTAAGRLRNVAAKVKHGGRATSDTYLAALRSAHPDLFDSAGGKPDLSRELAFARARLASLALLGDAATPKRCCMCSTRRSGPGTSSWRFCGRTARFPRTSSKPRRVRLEPAVGRA